MRKIDVIILSYSKTYTEYRLTCECLETMRRSEQNIEFNIVVVETNYKLKNETFAGKKLYNDGKATVLLSSYSFNYNLFLQFGYEELKNSDAEFLFIGNNDLIFQENWASNILKYADQAQSFSPWCPILHPRYRMKPNKWTYSGYDVRKYVCGWALMMNKSIFEIEPFEEFFPSELEFWFQDDFYSQMLRIHNLKHLLVKKSKVIHLESRSHSLIHSSKKHRMTRGAKQVYQRLINQKKAGETISY